MKPLELVIGFSFLFTYSFSQNSNWFIQANLGVSKMPSEYYGMAETGRGIDFSWSIGGGIEKKLFENIYFQTGLNITNFRDKISNSLPLGQLHIDNQVLYFMSSTYSDKTSAYYLSLPVSFKLQFWRVGLSSGFQVQYFLHVKEKEVYRIINSVGDIYRESKETKKQGFKKINYGPIAELSFRISPSCSIQASYYYGLNNILRREYNIGFSRKIRQLTVGLRFYL